MTDQEPVVTAKKYMAYKRERGHIGQFHPPAIILVCYQQTLLKYLMKKFPEIAPCASFSDLYYIYNGGVGILGGWGMGAPALAAKLEQLIEMGVTRFLAIGLAGSLVEGHQIADFAISTKALAEDGVSHHYLPEGVLFADADPALIELWAQFAKRHGLPPFHDIPAWSFSAIFRETPHAIRRAKAFGCGLVEMEAATLYAIGQQKKVQTLSLFVVSDTLTEEHWVPHLKEPAVSENLYKLSDYAITFCKTLLG